MRWTANREGEDTLHFDRLAVKSNSWRFLSRVVGVSCKALGVGIMVTPQLASPMVAVGMLVGGGARLPALPDHMLLLPASPGDTIANRHGW